MDQKTLEYMGERVDKARAINKLIAIYEDRLERLGSAKNVEVQGDRGNFYVHADEKLLVSRLATEMRNVLSDEIDKLKKELDQL